MGDNPNALLALAIAEEVNFNYLPLILPNLILHVSKFHVFHVFMLLYARFFPKLIIVPFRYLFSYNNSTVLMHTSHTHKNNMQSLMCVCWSFSNLFNFFCVYSDDYLILYAETDKVGQSNFTLYRQRPYEIFQFPIIFQIKSIILYSWKIYYKKRRVHLCQSLPKIVAGPCLMCLCVHVYVSAIIW